MIICDMHQNHSPLVNACTVSLCAILVRNHINQFKALKFIKTIDVIKIIGKEYSKTYPEKNR